MPIHLRANPGDYAEACLLPGDPLRAKYIAETFLTDVVQVNAERGLLGFTGKWEGKPVSVQGTGMGCPAERRSSSRSWSSSESSACCGSGPVVGSNPITRSAT